jgi:predicted rRNA methylase YqxC with S4 and FtsJ domains
MLLVHRLRHAHIVDGGKTEHSFKTDASIRRAINCGRVVVNGKTCNDIKANVNSQDKVTIMYMKGISSV